MTPTQSFRMAIFNKRTRVSKQQLKDYFLRRNSILAKIYGVLRILVIIVENLYCIPSYLVILWFALFPVSWIKSELYWKVENYLYNSLIFVVSSWSLTAGLTIVESGDEYRHLLGEKQDDVLNAKAHDVRGCVDDQCEAVAENYTRLQVNNYIKRSRNGKQRQQNQILSTNSNSPTTRAAKLRTKNSNSNGFSNHYEGNKSGDSTQLDSKMQDVCSDIEHIHELNNKNQSSDIENEILRNNNNNIEKSSEQITARKKLNSYALNGKSTNQNSIEQVDQISKTVNELTPLKNISEKPRILFLCNHVSMADVPLIMQSFSTLTNQSMLWVLDSQFKYTNFGICCCYHGDFFVAKNKFSEGLLRDQVLKHPDRNMLVLFPEGGFLRKRLEGSNRYAVKNGLPLTKYVTHPRFGAFKDLMDPSVGVTHIVDATLLYNDIEDPISILDVFDGTRKEPAILNYKLYERSEIEPTEEWLRGIWLEKDKFLSKYYEDRESVFAQIEGTMRAPHQDWFKILAVHLFYILVFYLATFRLLRATNSTMLKASEFYHSYI